ncbi:MAG: hypothetical protein WC756_17270 [Taibaiella sp.]|jgi:hypothetical protein
MDTHKDFIHIDDVFKDLRNGEEPEPSGAWMRMKDLLDKEMPAGAPVSAGKSFRRYIIPLVALLLAGGGFTYYKMNQDSKDNATLNPSTSVIAGKTTGYDKASHLNSGNNADAVHGVSTPEAGNVSSGTEKKNNINNVGRHTSANNIPDNNKNNLTAATKQSNNTVAGNATRTDIQKTSPAGNIASSKKMEEQRVIEEIKPTPASGTPSTNNQPAIANNTASTVSSSNTVDPENTFNSGNNNPKKIAATLNNKKIVQTADGSFYKEERDTFKRIDIISRTVAGKANGRNTVKTVLDTVAITRVERISYLPLNALEMVALRKILVADTRTRTLIPVANLKEKIVSNEMVSLVPLANYKVASRRVDPGKFNQLVQNTSQGIANYFDGSRNFYAALIVGGNTSFGNPGAFGLQLGIAGLYQLSERLTLSAELKYVNHYFSNYSLDDQSVTFENINSQQVSGIEWLFSGTQKTTTSSYKINNFGALEMPITLNYNLGRVSVFGGLNMAYAFPIKWSKENTLNTVPVQQTRAQNENPFLNSNFVIDEQKDFSSRFGLGYVWGLNYDLSRKVSLDARMTQILWDNNKGNTDAIKRLFHVPTLQVSFGYYFGRKDKVIYIMDKR